MAYYILERQLISVHGKDSTLMQALGRDWKGLTSVALYALAIVLAFRAPKVSILIYFFVALLWLKPDPRIEKRL